MHLATQSSSQLQTIFGSGYVIEQRCDDTCRHLPRDDSELGLNFSNLLAGLRAALSLR